MMSPRPPLKVHGRIPLYECLVLDCGSSDSFVVARSSGKSFVAMAASEAQKQASVMMSVRWSCPLLQATVGKMVVSTTHSSRSEPEDR